MTVNIKSSKNIWMIELKLNYSSPIFLRVVKSDLAKSCFERAVKYVRKKNEGNGYY